MFFNIRILIICIVFSSVAVMMHAMDKDMIVSSDALSNDFFDEIVCVDPLCKKRQKAKLIRSNKRIKAELKRIEAAMEDGANVLLNQKRIVQGVDDFVRDQTNLISDDACLVIGQMREDNPGFEKMIQFIQDPRKTAMDALGLEEVPRLVKFREKIAGRLAYDKQFKHKLYSCSTNTGTFVDYIARGDRSVGQAVAENSSYASFDKKDLYIVNAKINTLHDLPTSFSHAVLKNLQHIDLSGNSLRSASIPLLFDVSPLLKKINIAHNEITGLTAGDIKALAAARNIEELNASHNYIDTVERIDTLKWRKNQSNILHIKLDHNMLSKKDVDYLKNIVKLNPSEEAWVEIRPHLYNASKWATAGLLGYAAIKILTRETTHAFVAPIVDNNFKTIYREGAKITLNQGVNFAASFTPLRTGFALSEIHSRAIAALVDNAESMPLQKELEYAIKKTLVDTVANTTDPLTLYNRWSDPTMQSLRSTGLQITAALQHPLAHTVLANVAPQYAQFVRKLPCTEQQLKNVESAVCATSSAAIMAGVWSIGAVIDGLADLAIPNIKNPYCPVVVTTHNQQPKKIVPAVALPAQHKSTEL